jgi:ABC-type amino acid transport substrate-binding protein
MTWLMVLSLLSVQTQPAQAEKVYKVGVNVSPPSVVMENGGYAGFEIDLFESVAKELDLNFEYVEVEKFDSLLPLIIDGECDFALGGITITRKREAKLDFAVPHLETGLRTAVITKTEARWITAGRYIFSPGTMAIFVVFVIFIIIFGFAYKWLERKQEWSYSDSQWYVFLLMTTIGEGCFTAKTIVGRWFAKFVWLFGAIIVAFLIASMSSAMTVERLESEITDASDLRGKRVATIKGTTSVDTLNRLGAIVTTVSHLEVAFSRLLMDKVDAVVYDEPALFHYAKTQSNGKFTLVGPTFDLQYYGIAMIQGSPLREKINRVLLEMKDSGEYEQIKGRWLNE